MTIEDDITLADYQKMDEKAPPTYDDTMNGNVNGDVPDNRNGNAKKNYENKGFDSNGDVGVEIKDPEKDGKKKKKKDEEPPPPAVGVFAMFRFGTCLDYFLMIIGTLGAMGHGAALPLVLLFFGEMIDSFAVYSQLEKILSTVNFTQYGTTREAASQNYSILFPIMYQEGFNKTAADLLAQGSAPSTLMDRLTYFAILYVGLGCAVLVAAYLQIMCWLTASERQCWKIRTSYFRSVMKQEIGWFDLTETGQLATRLSDDINKIKEGIGDKLANFFQWFTTFIAGITIGFVNGWLLTLVILAVSPLLVICAALMTKLAGSLTSKELTAYAKAGGVAEEVISAIRTVAAFGGEQKEVKRYVGNLSDAEKFGIKKGVTNGLSLASVWGIMMLAYALGFWYGSVLIHDEAKNYTVGQVIIVFFAVIFGAFSLGSAAPNLQAFATGRGAAFSVYSVIDRESKIDPTSEEGERPATMEGNVLFKNVDFIYPSREEVKVMDRFNLTIKRGQTVALCGQSGCGKSTSVQLLQRFYDPIDGQILLDGRDLKSLNIQWLRQHIGVVSQEPILFATTIAENIRYGRDGVTDEEIEQACRESNAHDFISDLPDKYQTLVGERGAQLSGGQKQRIAIARALVRDPKILLLDEATSALDTESESVVQAALDKVKQGRTTLVVAHRLSTIQNADIIVGIKDGQNVEQGTHSELMFREGLYYNLVMAQSKKKSKEEEATELQIIEESESDSDEPLPPTPSKTPLKKSSIRMKSGRKRTISGMSVASDEEKGDDEKKGKDNDEEPKPSFGRVLAMNKPEWGYIVGGCFASLINGGIQPAFAIIFAEFIGVFGETNRDIQRERVNLYCILFVCIGVLMFFSMFLQSYFFAKSGEALTKRLRQLTFTAMLKQEIGYFDSPKNSTGALTTRLAVDASAVQGATGVRLGSILQSISNMGTALIISFIYGWKLTLVILAFVPFIAVGGFVEMKIMAGVSNKDKEAVEDAGKVAIEGISNIRTVAQLTKETKFMDLYAAGLTPVHKASIKQAHLIGFVFGLTQAIIDFVHAAAFAFGAYLIQQNEMDFTSVFKVFGAIVFGAMALGQASSFAPDYGKAVSASGRIFGLLDREPEIDSSDPEGEKPSDVAGAVDLKDVRFRYPTRPNVTILRGLDVSAKPGQVVALVGSSGCGKSTCVSIVERFYEAEGGEVMIDGKNITKWNIKHLRSQMGIVSQEPILFDRSIAENIAYGDNTREDIPMAEIIAAARNANIHSFIESLPEGYETNCGDKGTQLSGGQKQRVAIARALIRNPKILLLDEATSALDNESEKVVQEALDAAQKGRTSIVIAHRLSTIRNADKIYVIQHGKVKEVGKHDDLLAAKGIYYKLNNVQLQQI
ncbi:ATP-dependent translocase ABCB1-like isoform X1 [Lineus longissimus]|uniref:ATP-dependent translocase ABCB1-like isoform X1 n=1 Tax=Lineus longissimus TaxID=88925 RepID=UPI002B4E3F86